MKQIVKVKFISKTSDGYDLYPKEYWYIFKSKEKMEVKAGDFAVIESVQDRDQEPFSVVKVVEAKEYSYDRINEIEENINNVGVKSKELIGKADLSSYFAEKERQEKIRQINANLVNRFKQAEKLALYKQLAESDPVMKDLLAQLESLGGTVDMEDLSTEADLY